MKRLWFLLLFLFWVSPAHAQPQAMVNDDAVLLTLEPKQIEMYPKVSPDSQFLLVLTGKHKQHWVSRRAIENGDPLNVVTEDAEATSFHWYGDEVVFLSKRTGSLALWRKPADGEGLMHRSHELSGMLQDVTLLKDGSAIAVRILPEQGKRKAIPPKRQKLFNNWSYPGMRTFIVMIHADGVEERLSQGINPAVSPDGKAIVFSMAIGRSMHLFILDLQSKELTELTDARSMDVQPAWSADGKWIVFASNRSKPDMRSAKKGQWDIWKISSEGQGLTQLTFDPAHDGAPSMAANGDIYFHSDRKINKDLKAERQVKSSTKGFHIWKIRNK